MIDSSVLHKLKPTIHELIELLKKAKADERNVTSSVAAHNLLLDDSKLFDFDSNLKVNPPLRFLRPQPS